MLAGTGAIWQFLSKNWPHIVRALQAVDAFLKIHPGVSTWIRQQLEEIRGRVVSVQKRRGEAAKIRGMLEIVKDVALELDTHAGHLSTADATTWIRRADDIERGVRIAETQARPDRKKSLARLRAETDVLLAEVIDAMAGVRPLPATATTDDETHGR